jgi:hypothetical protein
LDQGKSPVGKQLLEPGTIIDMFAPKILNSKEDKTSIGYSWWRRDIKEGYLVSHGGGMKGQITQLTLFPEKGFAFAVFTNSDKGQLLIKKMNKFILKEFVGVALDLPKEIESTPEQLAAFEGTASRPGFKFYLKMMGDHLVGLDQCTIGFPTEKDPPPPPSPPYKVGRCGEDRLIVLDGDDKDTPIDVFRDSEGAISHVRAGRIYKFNQEK